MINIIEKPKQSGEVIEDEILIYNIFGVCVRRISF